MVDRIGETLRLVQDQRAFEVLLPLLLLSANQSDLEVQSASNVSLDWRTLPSKHALTISQANVTLGI